MNNTIENIIQSLIEFNTISFFSEANNEKLPKWWIEVTAYLVGGIDDLPNFLKANELPPPIIYDLTNELEKSKSYLYKLKLNGVLEYMLKYNIDKWLFYIYDKYPSLRSATIQEQHTTPTETQPTQVRLEPKQYDNTTSDFEQMESFKYEREINLDGLYSFLIEKEVIKNVNQAYITNCIFCARLDLLLKLPEEKIKKNKLKYTFYVLAEYMERDWRTKVCELSGLPASKLSGANLSDKVDFGNQLKDSLKIQQ